MKTHQVCGRSMCDDQVFIVYIYFFFLLIKIQNYTLDDKRNKKIFNWDIIIILYLMN